MNTIVDESELDAYLEQLQDSSEPSSAPESDYLDPLLSRLTEQELSGTENSACRHCPPATWFFRQADKGLPTLTAYCPIFHKNSFGGDSRDEIGIVSRCSTQIRAIEALKAAMEKARREASQ